MQMTVPRSTHSRPTRGRDGKRESATRVRNLSNKKTANGGAALRSVHGKTALPDGYLNAGCEVPK
jgi:hypothetical protein